MIISKIGKINFIYLIVIIVIVVGLLYVMYNKYFITNSNSTEFEKINTQLDNEHTNILNTIDKLYGYCEKHWKTEDDLYEKGLKQMPKGHKDITIEWKEHQDTHVALLKNIQNMKQEIVEHINNVDSKHFHWCS